MEEAFKQADNNVNYYELLMPEGTDEMYWIASRCIDNHSSSCAYSISYVNEGRIDVADIFYSNANSDEFSLRIISYSYFECRTYRRRFN